MPPRTKRIEIEPGPFLSVDDAVAAVQSSGSHFFSADTMRSFGSRVDDEIFGGRFFVTSERSGFDRSSPRRYTVRVVLPLGEIEELGDFLAFDTLVQARRAAKRAAEGTFETRHDPYGDEPTVSPAHYYAWRTWSIPAWVRGQRAIARSEFPIGARRTKRDADRMTRLLQREALGKASPSPRHRPGIR